MTSGQNPSAAVSSARTQPATGENTQTPPGSRTEQRGRRLSGIILIVALLCLAAPVADAFMRVIADAPLLAPGLAIGLTCAGLGLGLFSLLSKPFPIAGRALNLSTAAASVGTLGVGAACLGVGWAIDAVLPVFLGAAFLPVLRSIALRLVPPQTSKQPRLQTLLAVAAAVVTGGIWSFIDPVTAPAIGAAVLCASWPFVADGVTASGQRAAMSLVRARGIDVSRWDSMAKLTNCKTFYLQSRALFSNDLPIVTDVVAFSKKPEPLLAVAASAEHPAQGAIAEAIRTIALDWAVPVSAPEEFEAAPGYGVVAMLGGEAVAVGNSALMEHLGIDNFTADSLCRPLETEGKTCLRVAVGKRIAGIIALQGHIHPHAAELVAGLKLRGQDTCLLSWDSRQTAGAVAQSLHLDGFVDVPPGCPELPRLRAAGGVNGDLMLDRPDGGGVLTVHDAFASEASGNAILLQIPDSRLSDLPDLVELTVRSRDLSHQMNIFALVLAALAGVVAAFNLLPVVFTPSVSILALGAAYSQRFRLKRIF